MTYPSRPVSPAPSSDLGKPLSPDGAMPPPEAYEEAQKELKVLALLPSAGSVAPCLTCALGATYGLNAKVEAMHIGFNAELAASLSDEEMGLQYYRELTEGTPVERQEATRVAFETWVEAMHPKHSMVWNSKEGDVGEEVKCLTANVDLAVMRSPFHLDGRDALHSVLFRARKLLLVSPRDVPEGATGPATTIPPIGQSVLIGWKRGPAERAIRAALPWLRHAKKITAIAAFDRAATPDISDAKAFFSELGLRADVLSLQKSGPSVGMQLQKEAINRGADCLLLGAFRHGMLWEALLGGVTHDVLENTRLPIFMMA